MTRPTSIAATLPAPVGGWNARDSLTSMGATDAVTMTNWYPSTTEVILRNGYTQYATGFPSQVETLMAYSGATTDKLFGISNGSVYDATSGGAVGAAAVTGLSNSRWQYVNIATSGGNYLYMMNGVDTPYLYDGSSWTAITGVSTPAITGVTTTTLNNPCMFKNRLFMIQQDTLKAWYLPVQSVGGAAQVLDMSSFCQLGGYLTNVATWTVDAGTGVDDYLVFMTNRGEVIVWEGTDASSPTTWGIKGIWRVGAPIGSRAMIKYAGDLLIICQDGVMPMSGALQSSRVNPRVALSNKIQNAVSLAVSSYGSNFGWELLYFPKENQIWLNVPTATGYQQQYVMNTITGAWCNFDGWAANTFCLFHDNPYFGGNTFIAKAWNGLTDDGANINGNGLQAFNSFRKSGLLKRFTMAKPIFRVGGPVNVGVAINVDFDLNNNTPAVPAAANFSLGTWDVTTWDNCIWGSLSVQTNWYGATGIGEYAAPYVSISSNGTDVRWDSTTIVFERGAIL